MKLISSAFDGNGKILVKYARRSIPGGQNISPPLAWEGAPADTRSFAISMVDASARNFVHWLVIDIPKDITSVPEGASNKNMPAGSKELANTFGSFGYGGPEPPSGAGNHDYVITVYALDVDTLVREGRAFPSHISYDEFLYAIKGSVLDQATLTGKFGRKAA